MNDNERYPAPEKWKEVAEMGRLIRRIKALKPNDVRFTVTPDDIKTIFDHIQANRFKEIMYLYGHKFVLALLEHYVNEQDYEKCTAIKAQIEQHNESVNDNLSTK